MRSSGNNNVSTFGRTRAERLSGSMAYEMAAVMMVKTKKFQQSLQNSAYEMATLKQIAWPFNGLFKGHKLLSRI